jgi:hypothetical protein
MAVNKFETFLSKLGKDTKTVVKDFFSKVLPEAVKVAQVAEPIVAIAAASAGAPSLGLEFTTVVNAVASAEAAGNLAATATGTGPQKLAAVIAAVTPQLLPTLTGQGLTTDAAATAISTYAQAVVTVLNTFPVTTATPTGTATAGAPAA